jgi:hypothetical protein
MTIVFDKPEPLYTGREAEALTGFAMRSQVNGAHYPRKLICIEIDEMEVNPSVMGPDYFPID